MVSVKWKNVLIIGLALLLLIMLLQGDNEQGRREGGSFLPHFVSEHRDVYTLISWAMLLAVILVIVKLIFRERR